MDFSVQIKALLNTESIRSIENTPITLKNITAETKSLISSIQSVLNNQTFNIKLDNMSGAAKNAQAQGIKAGNNFTDGFVKATNKFRDKGFNSVLKTIGGNLESGKALGVDKYDVLISKLESRIAKLGANSKIDLKSIGLSTVNNSGNGSESDRYVQKLYNLKKVIAETYSHGNYQGAISAHEKLISLINGAGIAMDKLEVSTNDYAAAAAKAGAKSDKLITDTQAWMKANPKAAKIYASQFEDIFSKIREDKTNPEVYSNMSAEIAKIKSQAKAAGLTVDTFAKSLRNAALQAVGLNSLFDVFQKVIQIGKQMYQNVYDIDTAMTNLYKVTDESNERYDRFLNSSASSAKELGRSVSSLIEQSATWSKLGYSLDEAEQLAKVSSVYANVGEVGDDTAVSDLVTAMKAFNIEASDAITIVDALNELGNNFATSAANLGDGLSRSASSMKLAGASANETLAMLTGISEITQNAPEAGNALKIFSMRVRGMKGELEELGEEVDSSVDSISKVQTQILNLTNGRINIFDDNGEFRNYYEIMKDIADIFDELKSVDQANLSEVLFGKQRGNTGAALIQAFQSGQVEKALTAANESAGSAAQEQSRWMESLEAKTGQLKAAWQELSQTTLNSDFLKNSIDGLRTLTEYTTKAIDKFGLLPGVLAGSGIAAFIKNFDQPKAVMSTQKTSVYHGERNIIMAILIIPWEESFKIRKGIIA